MHESTEKRAKSSILEPEESPNSCSYILSLKNIKLFNVSSTNKSHLTYLSYHQPPEQHRGSLGPYTPSPFSAQSFHHSSWFETSIRHRYSSYPLLCLKIRLLIKNEFFSSSHKIKMDGRWTGKQWKAESGIIVTGLKERKLRRKIRDKYPTTSTASAPRTTGSFPHHCFPSFSCWPLHLSSSNFSIGPSNLTSLQQIP